MMAAASRAAPFFSAQWHMSSFIVRHILLGKRVFQTPTMRAMIRTGIIFIATQTLLSTNLLSHSLAAFSCVCLELIFFCTQSFSCSFLCRASSKQEAKNAPPS